MDGQWQLVLSLERACPVVIIRLHHSYLQLHEDHPDAGVERNLQYHFEKKSYRYHVVFDKRKPSLRIWAFPGVGLNEQPSDRRWEDQLL